MVALPDAPRAAASSLLGIAAISAGGSHTCALTTAGGVKCWGLNFYGELGDGTTTARSAAVDVSGLTSGVAAVSAGQYHTCALTTAGGVKCWGYNGNGQLGDGSGLGISTTPVDASGLTSGVAAVSAGGSHTCALTTGGGVKCWGYNSYGELGDGTTTARTTPVEVSSLTGGVTAVSTSGNDTCALTAAGGVKCWGNNFRGKLGDGSGLGISTTPVDVSGLTSGGVAVSAGADHTCALTTAGGVRCWGVNGSGQLGDGTTTESRTPVDVSGVTGSVAAVFAGGSHTCALTTTGGVKCWGANASGQIGNGTTSQSRTPVDVAGVTDSVTAVTTGGSHTCALTTTGGVKCWGANAFGQLGNGTTNGPDCMETCSSTPVDVVAMPPYSIGDVNCDGSVNSIDAALILQLSARLVSLLPCQQNADVNGDGSVDPVDAALILQYGAGLIHNLPS